MDRAKFTEPTGNAARSAVYPGTGRGRRDSRRDDTNIRGQPMSFGPIGSTPIASPFFLGGSATPVSRVFTLVGLPDRFRLIGQPISYRITGKPGRFILRGRP